MGARKNARERRRYARRRHACLPRVRPFFLAPIYFLAPAMQAITLVKANIERQLVTFRQNLKHCINFLPSFWSDLRSFFCVSITNAVVNQNKSRHIFEWKVLCKNGKQGFIKSLPKSNAKNFNSIAYNFKPSGVRKRENRDLQNPQIWCLSGLHWA